MNSLPGNVYVGDSTFGVFDAEELLIESGSFGQRNASIWPLSTTRAPRVWEIDRPAAWVRLVEQYPLDVTNARRHDWYKTTGRAGTWLIPDLSAVAADWDAVHVSVAGYLTTATRALPVADGTAATMLAGWNPDQTWWLTDILATTTPHPAESWHNPEDPDGSDFGWRLASAEPQADRPEHHSEGHRRPCTDRGRSSWLSRLPIGRGRRSSGG